MDNNYSIWDRRSIKDFTGKTFSGCKLTSSLKNLEVSLLASDIETVCFRAADIFCAGHLKDLFQFLFIFFAKFMSGNTKMLYYLHLRWKTIFAIQHAEYSLDGLLLRNNQKARKIITELCCVFAMNKKSAAIEFIKLDRNLELFADSQRFANAIWNRTKDPEELFIPFNELGNSLEQKNTFHAEYWIEFIIGVDTQSNFNCATRPFDIDDKYKQNVIWVMWELFLQSIASNENKTKTIMLVLDLFTENYRPSFNRKLKSLLYYVAHYIISDIPEPENPILLNNEQKIILKNIMKNTDIPYIEFSSQSSFDG